MKTEIIEPLDSNLQHGVNEALREKLEIAKKDMAKIKILNNTTRDLVSKDVNDLFMTENPKEINEALIVIGHKANIQPIYRTDLRESAPEIAKEAAEALNKYQRSLIDEDRKGTEQQPVVKNRESQENIITFNDRTQERPVSSNQSVTDSTAKQATNQDMSENAPIPMQSMVGKTMSFNDQPGRRGAEIVDEDGTRIVFGGKQEIDRFVRVNKLSKEDAQTLNELDAKKYSPSNAPQIAENENDLRIPMKSMPDHVMIYNGQPGRQGVEVWKPDGTHVAFGSEEAFKRFVKEHKVSRDDVRALSELESLKNNSPTNKPQESTNYKAADLSQASVSPAYGVMQIDDKPVTSIRFERSDKDGEPSFNVSYHMGNKSVMKLKTLDTDMLIDAVGNKNAKAIIEHNEAKGLLKGETLINEYGISPEEKVRRINDANKLEVIDSKEAVLLANQHRKREKIDLGLNIEGKQSNELETSRRTNNPQENIIAFNDRTKEKPQTINQPVTEQVDEKQTASTAKQTINKDMPESVSNRYLRIKDNYYFQDKTMAFEDKGNKLKLETENHTVIKDALIIAETRNWQSITVSGTDNFKHQVWREASLKGIEVAGYKPSKIDEAELKQAIALRDVKKEASVNPQTQSVKAQQQEEGVIAGTLIAHGADHYKHDKKESKSYYAKVNVGGKEMTYWGVDLERAINESQSNTKVGDAIKLKNIGQELVSIKVDTLDENGKKIGQETKTVNRNSWIVEKAESFDAIRKQEGVEKPKQAATTGHPDALHEQAEAFRVGKVIEHKVIEQMPQLAAAIAVSKLGEKIAQQALATGALRSQDEVDTMVHLIRDGLATALKNGKHIKIPEIQEQGKRAAVDANNVLNDQKPPAIVKEPQQQDMAMTR
jgi:putative DNA primase/helicase